MPPDDPPDLPSLPELPDDLPPEEQRATLDVIQQPTGVESKVMLPEDDDSSALINTAADEMKSGLRNTGQYPMLGEIARGGVGAFGKVLVVAWNLARALARGGHADEKEALPLQSQVSVVETIDPLETSIESSTAPHDIDRTCSRLPLAQAHHHLDEAEEANRSYDEAVAWIEANPSLPLLERFRQEANLLESEPVAPNTQRSPGPLRKLLRPGGHPAAA